MGPLAARGTLHARLGFISAGRLPVRVASCWRKGRPCCYLRDPPLGEPEAFRHCGGERVIVGQGPVNMSYS